METNEEQFNKHSAKLNKQHKDYDPEYARGIRAYWLAKKREEGSRKKIKNTW